MASIGLAQLNRLKARISYAKRIYRLYEQLLTRVPYLKLIPVNIEAGEIPIYIEVLSAKRDKLVEFLAGNGIQSRPFYPDLNQAGHLGCGGIFKHSEVFGKQGLFLPCGPAQSISNIERTVEVLRKFR